MPSPGDAIKPRLDKMHHINGSSDIKSNMNNSGICIFSLKMSAFYYYLASNYTQPLYN
jgi:hypothetical protein